MILNFQTQNFLIGIFLWIIGLKLFRLLCFPKSSTGIPNAGSLAGKPSERMKAISKLRKMYGDLFYVKIDSKRVLVISDYKIVRAAFCKLPFSGKVKSASGDKSKDSCVNEVKEHFQKRHFFIKTLKNFGFGTQSMEHSFQTEISTLIADFHAEVGKPLCFFGRFCAATINPLWLISIGKRFTESSEDFNKLKWLVSEISKVSKIFLVGDMLSVYNRNRAEVRSILQEIINTCKCTWTKDNNRSLIDSYLSEISSTTDPKSCFYGKNGESTMISSLNDILLGGIESTSTALAWAFLTLAANQNVQEKLIDEIVKVVGNDQLPKLIDRKRMPYTKAVIMEVMRFGALNPQTHHQTTEDALLSGHLIPKDTVILANYLDIFHDVALWEDPENFRPERFMSKDGEQFLGHEALLLFSVGKRVCPAENFAKDQLFIYLVSLFQNFRVKLAPNHPKPTFKASYGVFSYPEANKVVLEDIKGTLNKF